MENLNRTNFKKRGPKLLIRLASQLHREFPDIAEHIKSHPDFTISNEANALFLNSFNSKISINFKYGPPLSVAPKNLVAFLKGIKNEKSLNSTEIKKGTKHTSSSLNKLKDFWQEEHFDILKLTEFSLKSTNLSTFVQSILTLSNWRDFKTIHVFLHEKGQQNSEHIQITSDSTEKQIQNVSEFNSLFTAIKKSKNRSFGQSTLKASNFQILGTCLAKEFSLKQHNLILVFSKNDFLPQKEEDIINFNNFTSYLKSFLECSLELRYQREKTKLAIDTFLNLPFEFELKKQDKTILSQTEDVNLLSKTLTFLDYTIALETSESRKLNYVDISHKERIILLGELLNTLKHELSNPLFGLQLSSELLLTEEFQEDQKEFLTEIKLSIKRCQSIINNFSYLYRNDQKLEEVNLLQLVEEVFTLTKSASRNIQREIIAKQSINSPIMIKTNQTWLAQIIFNLIINSSQAMTEGKIQSPKIDIIIEEEKCENFIVVYFKDNGPGLPSHFKENIFKPFYTTKENGNGLGLSISKSLAEKLQGSLECSSDKNGAEFILRIPR